MNQPKSNMIGDHRIESLDTHLEQFKISNNVNQNELQTVLREYSELLDDYKALKIAFEEKNVASVVPGGTSNSTKGSTKETLDHHYVLVLVDGNGYVFNDELAKAKEEGGMKAARLLNEAVAKYIMEFLPDYAGDKIVVRIYADLTELSRSLAKAQLSGLEKRSFSSFAAGFTRSFGLFDFIDTLDEEGTKFKIRETFKQAAEDSACNHILFAACHDEAYRTQLVPYSGLRKKITIVQGANFDAEFHQFHLNITQFPTIFRWSALHSGATNILRRDGTTAKARASIKFKNFSQAKDDGENGWETYGGDALSGVEIPASTTAHGTTGSGFGNLVEGKKSWRQVPCKYFKTGFCRYGNECSFLHPETISPRLNIALSLPTLENLPPGYIPVNKDNVRIDAYFPPPTPAEWLTYNTRFHQKKPCNSFQLLGQCEEFKCPFDHEPLEPDAYRCLQYVLKCSPCPRKGACRLAGCYYGHICQKDGCQGHLKGCKMKADLHTVDPGLQSLVPAEEKVEQHQDVAWY